MKKPHIVATTLVDKEKNKDSNSNAKLIPNSRTALIATDNNDEKKQDTRQEKFAEFLRTEKLKKYKRVPRVYGKRTP